MLKTNYKYTGYLILLLITAGCAEKPVEESQAEAFVKFYGSGVNDKGSKVIQLDDGGYAVLGTVATPDRGTDLCLILTDRYGDFLQPMSLYGTAGDDVAVDMEFDGTSFYLLGNTYDADDDYDVDTYEDFLIVKTDLTGSQLWINYYTYPPPGEDPHTNENAQDMIIDGNGDIVITGSTDAFERGNQNQPMQGGENIMLVKVDQGGEAIKYSPPIGYMQDEVGNAVIETLFHGSIAYIVAGWTRSEPLNTNTSNVWLIRFTSNFIPVGSNVEELAGDSKAESIANISEGKYIVACERSPGNENAVLFTSVLNTDDMTLSDRKEYPYGDIESVSQIMVHSNKIYTLFNDKTSSSTASTVLMTTAVDGSNEVFYTFGEGVRMLGSGFANTTNNGFVITGENGTGENSIIYLLKLDSSFSLKN